MSLTSTKAARQQDLKKLFVKAFKYVNDIPIGGTDNFGDYSFPKCQQYSDDNNANQNQQNINLDILCNRLSTAVIEIFYQWINENKKGLAVKVPHAFSNESHIALSGQKFSIEEGTSVPKGLDI